MNFIRVIYSTLKLQMKNSFARPMYRFCLVASPIVNTILLYHMFLNSNMDNFTTYVMLGAGLMGLWSCICFSSAGDINRERFSGTLSLIYVTPTSFGVILLGKVIGNTILSFVSLVISFLTAVLLYQAPIHIEEMGYLMLSIFAAMLCFITISILIAYLLTLSRKTQLYMNCIEVPIIFVCGFLFPVEILPSWVQPISYILAPTWAVKLIRLSVSGFTDSLVYFKTLGILCFLTIMYTIGILMLYKVIDREVRIRASLELS